MWDTRIMKYDDIFGPGRFSSVVKIEIFFREENSMHQYLINNNIFVFVTVMSITKDTSVIHTYTIQTMLINALNVNKHSQFWCINIHYLFTTSLAEMPNKSFIQSEVVWLAYIICRC